MTKLRLRKISEKDPKLSALVENKKEVAWGKFRVIRAIYILYKRLREGR